MQFKDVTIIVFDSDNCTLCDRLSHGLFSDYTLINKTPLSPLDTRANQPFVPELGITTAIVLVDVVMRET